MGKHILLISLFCISLETAGFAGKNFEADSVKTSGGKLEITFTGHGTLMFTFGGKVIHVDPFSRLTDYSKLPQADTLLGDVVAGE